MSVPSRASQCGHAAIGNALLLLFADADIAPVLLSGLSDVDELMVARGCRFALDVFTIAQQDRPLPDPVPLAHDPGSRSDTEL